MSIEKYNINLGINLGDKFKSFQDADAKIEKVTYFQKFCAVL